MDGISRSRGWDKEIPHGVLPMEQLVLSDKWARINRFHGANLTTLLNKITAKIEGILKPKLSINSLTHPPTVVFQKEGIIFLKYCSKFYLPTLNKIYYLFH